MIRLNEVEILGIKILVLIHTGKMKMFHCATCSPEMRVTRNCEGVDSDTPVYYNDDIGEFYACPLRFVGDSLSWFIDEYEYHEKYPSTAPSYKEVNPRYWEAVKLYESYKFTVMNDTNNTDNQTDDSLNKMSNLFKK